MNTTKTEIIQQLQSPEGYQGYRIWYDEADAMWEIERWNAPSKRWSTVFGPSQYKTPRGACNYVLTHCLKRGDH